MESSGGDAEDRKHERRGELRKMQIFSVVDLAQVEADRNLSAVDLAQVDRIWLNLVSGNRKANKPRSQRWRAVKVSGELLCSSRMGRFLFRGSCFSGLCFDFRGSCFAEAVSEEAVSGAFSPTDSS